MSKGPIAEAVAEGLALRIAEDLRESIVNLGYPVGMGLAPPPETCLLAGRRIVERIKPFALALLAEKEGRGV